MRPRDQVEPTFKAGAFNCPHCDAYAHMTWASLSRSNWPAAVTIDGWAVAVCSMCQAHTLWSAGELEWPQGSVGPMLHRDAPPSVADDYNEARAIASQSPRAACALLRRAVEQLCIALSAQGDKLAQKIKSLEARGLPVGVAEAMTAVRLIGNDAVHVGEIVAKDDLSTALALFAIVNTIVARVVEDQKQIDAMLALANGGAAPQPAKAPPVAPAPPPVTIAQAEALRHRPGLAPPP